MMKQQERKVQNRQPKQIVPRQVWLSMTEEQQAQFIQTVERICQQLASRQMKEKEGHNVSD